jgi:hypothetical protein
VDAAIGALEEGIWVGGHGEPRDLGEVALGVGDHAAGAVLEGGGVERRDRDRDLIVPDPEPLRRLPDLDPAQDPALGEIDLHQLAGQERGEPAPCGIGGIDLQLGRTGAGADGDATHHPAGGEIDHGDGIVAGVHRVHGVPTTSMSLGLAR